MKYKNEKDLLVSELEKNGWENGDKQTTMRERFDEFSNREVVGSTKLKDFKYLYPDLLDFIEQELTQKDQVLFSPG